MAPGGPGGNSRGRGGKFKKFTRGGGKHFSRDLKPLDADGNEISMWSEDAKKKMGGSGSDDSDSDEDSEEDSDDDAGPSNATPAQELSREERKKEKKARKDAAIAKAKAGAIQVGDLPPSESEDDDEDDDMPSNPNHSKAARKQTIPVVKKDEDEDVEEAAEGVSKMSVSKPLTRKERDSAEAAAAKERYMKAHLAGKTDEAKADMARLAEIRAKRAADKARREAEEEERKAQEAVKRAEIEAKEAKKREAALGKPAVKKGGKKK